MPTNAFKVAKKGTPKLCHLFMCFNSSFYAKSFPLVNWFAPTNNKSSKILHHYMFTV